MVDAGRYQRGVLLLQFLDLRTGGETRLALHDNVEGIGRGEAAPLLGLIRLQTKQIADHARPVEQVDADRTLTQKPPRAADVDKIHETS
jgi:hypothetical protein